MVDEKKIEEIRRKMRESIPDDKMYVENEPLTSGSPEDTIAPDEDDEPGEITDGAADVSNIEKARERLRKPLEKGKMYWEDEPDTIGSSENTIAKDEEELDHLRRQREKDDERRSDD